MINYEKPVLNKEGKPLRILQCGKHTCIRVIKISRALKKIGYPIDLLTHNKSYGTKEFDQMIFWHDKRQFQNFLAENKDKYDIIECHNEPDEMVVWAREVISKDDKTKIVSNLHDIDSVRRKESIIPVIERMMVNDADGFVYVSLPTQTMTNKLHDINKPNMCLYSYCNKDVVDYDESKIKDRNNAIIYEGGANPVNDEVMNQIYPYRNILPLLKQLVVNGNEVHAFIGNADAFLQGQGLGVVLYPPTEYDKMMKSLVTFKWGALIFNNEKNTEPQVKYTLTNKAQEYLQAGLPSLACWCEESEKWVNKHKIGLTFNSIDDIGDCSKFDNVYEQLISNINTKRHELVMENFIWKSENLYAELLGVEKKGIPDKIKTINEFEYGKSETEILLK